MSKALSEGLGVPASPGTYSAALEGLTGVNEILMRRDPSIPPLYESGAHWELRPKDPSDTRWRYADEVATDGWGDCQALAAYRAAELRVKGADPSAHVRVYPTGENKYHAVVARGNGLVEDPSVALGMLPFPGAPMTNRDLPSVNGPRGGYPGGGSPGLNPDAIMGAKRRIARSVAGLHPVAAVCGVGQFGDETGFGPKCAVVKDAAPEYGQPTFHIVGHKKGGKRGFKGVHRVPLKGGSAVVGMTRTYSHPADCIGDAASLISDIAHGLAKSPAAIAMLSPFGAATTLALTDPSIQHALGKIGSDVKSAVAKKNGKSKPSNDSNGDSGGGWPNDWSVTGASQFDHEDAAIVGWGLSSLTHLLTAPAHAVANLVKHPASPAHAIANVLHPHNRRRIHPAATQAVVGWGLSNLTGLITKPLSAVKNLITHPSLSNLGRVAISPLAGVVNTLPGTSGLVNRAMGSGGSPAAMSPMSPQMMPGMTPFVPGMNPYGTSPGMPPGWPPGMPPGQQWLPPPGAPQFNTTNRQYQSPYSQQQPTADAYNAPTAADFGLPTSGTGTESSGQPTENQNLAVAFSDPSSQSALASYMDPAGGLGYWNT
jgi:hypothetical protein